MSGGDGRIREAVRRMQGYTPGEQPSDASIVKLNTNENPYPPSPRVKEALAGLDPADLRRYPDPSSTAVRERIAELHGVPRTSVWVGNGSDEVLALCTRAFVEDDDCIGFMDPSYSLYPVLAAVRGVEGRPTPLGPEFAWREPRGGHALFFLANPNAPTSLLVPPETVEGFCRGAAGVVVIDEAYADFADADCMDLARRLPNVLVARTLSKSFSLAGLRLGYAVGPEPLVAALDKVKDSYNVNALTQKLALAALNDIGHMRRNVRRVRATRARMAEALRMAGFAVAPSQANFLWVRPPGRTARAWFDALRERRILVRHFPGERTGAYLRVTVGTDAEADTLAAAVRELAT